MKNNTTNIAITTTVRSDLDSIKSFINYHLNVGISYIFIFFDDPQDANFNYFQFYHKSVQCILCNTQHWQTLSCDAKSNIEHRQTSNANWALSEAKKKGLDWISHIDIDELIYTKKNLKQALANLPKSIDVLWLPPLEAIPEQLNCKNPFKELHTFKRLNCKDEQYYDGHNRAAYFHGEYFRGHTGGKSITRLSNKVADLKLHQPIAVEPCTLKVSSLSHCYLLHYDCYDYHSWFTKWLRRIDGTATSGGRDNRKKQLASFREAYHKEDSVNELFTLYKKLYFIPKRTQEHLRERKMLLNIHINQNLFNTPNK